MGSPWQRRAETDGLTPASQWKRDGLAPAPQIGKGWDRPDIGKRKGMGSSRHHRAERDGIALAPQSGERWSYQGTAHLQDFNSQNIDCKI